MIREDEFKAPSAGIEHRKNVIASRKVRLAAYQERWKEHIIQRLRGEKVSAREGAEHPYRTIFQTMTEGAVSLSADGAVVDCNPAFASLLGNSVVDIIGSSFIDWLDQECRSEWTRVLETQSEPGRWDFRLLRRDGTRVPVYATVRALEAGGTTDARCVILFDTPDRERHAVELERPLQVSDGTFCTQQQESSEGNQRLVRINRRLAARYATLRQKAGRLKHADAMKTRFLSNLSHEFRNPLNSIFGLTSLLLYRVDGELNAEQKKLVEYIRRAADSLLELADDLLDLSKIEVGKINVHPTEFDAANTLTTLRAMLSPSLVTPAVQFVCDEPKNIPRLYSDEGKISQILRNFVTNAVKFTERGEIRVSACHDLENDQVIFSVCDTGIGIAPEDQEKIFDEFTQLASPVQGTVKGSGLGLFVCRKLAGLLGGQIVIESALGTGSKFSLVVPCRFAQAREGCPGENPLTRSALSEHRTPSPK
jgi:PAS domain S-box-containing protein